MDQSLKGLLFKEGKMMKVFFIGQFLIPTIIFTFGVSNGAGPVSVLSGLMAFGFLILPFAILFSLNTEAIQLGLWLHHPASIHRLLFVKFLNGLMCAVCYLLVLSLLIISIDIAFGVVRIDEWTLISLYFLKSVQMIIISIIPAVILLLLWTLYRWWRSYIGGFSIIAIIALIHFGVQLESYFHSTALYDALTNWGAISIPIANMLTDSEFLGISIGVIQFDGMETTLMLGTYVYYGVMTLLVYFISSYLIDRKVEV